MAEEPKTLQRMFWNTVTAHGDRVAQEWHTPQGWQSRTYGDYAAAVRDVAHGLLAAGVKKGDRVGVWSRNGPRWAEVDFACQTAGFVTVPVYDTLTGPMGAYILKDAGAKVLFVQDESVLRRILEHRSTARTVKLFVVMEGASGDQEDDVVSYDSLVADGRQYAAKHPDRLDELADDVGEGDLASLVYTSGTTGEPKGVMLSHRNFATNADCMHLVDLGPDDVFLSFLPLSHVFERTGGHFGAVNVGAKVVYARSLESLMDDMQHARPTIMMAVPRLYEKIYTRIQAKVEGDLFVKRMIFRWAIDVGRAANVYRQRNQELPASLARKVARADKLVYGKLKQRVGGRLRFFVSGGAALSREIEEFFWAAGIQVLQGYGLTETSPVCSVNLPHALRFGSVGQTVPGVEVRIDAQGWEPLVPGRKEGEICFKGPNIMQGYWKDAKATKAAFDRHGWLRTGDIGFVDDDGFLFITDRKKEILVLSTGKNVAPQPIENALKLQPHIAQACVVGDRRNYVAALLVPDWEALEEFVRKAGIATDERTRLVSDQRVVSLFEREVETVNTHLPRFEQVKKFWILDEEWSVEGGQLTPSLKLKRRVIEAAHGPTIDRLYPSDA